MHSLRIAPGLGHPFRFTLRARAAFLPGSFDFLFCYKMNAKAASNPHSTAESSYLQPFLRQMHRKLSQFATKAFLALLARVCAASGRVERLWKVASQCFRESQLATVAPLHSPVLDFGGFFSGSDYILLLSRAVLARTVPHSWCGLITGLDGSGRKVFAATFAVLVGLGWSNFRPLMNRPERSARRAKGTAHCAIGLAPTHSQRTRMCGAPSARRWPGRV